MPFGTVMSGRWLTKLEAGNRGVVPQYLYGDSSQEMGVWLSGFSGRVFNEHEAEATLM